MTIPKIAYDTIHYAVDCAMLDNRAMALDVINEEGNGLNEAQKAAICQKIQELQDRPRTVKEMNQLENRLIGVLQPATLKFLEDTKLIAKVLSLLSYLEKCAMSRPLLRDYALGAAYIAFSIQTSASEINKSYLKLSLRNRNFFTTTEIPIFLEHFYGPTPVGTTWNSAQIQGLLELAPEFYKLFITNEGTDKDTLINIAKAITKCGEKTKFRRIDEWGVIDNPPSLTTYQNFPHLSEFSCNDYVEAHYLVALLKFPHLEKLNIEIFPEILDKQYDFKNTKLKSLKLKIVINQDLNPNVDFTEQHVTTLKAAPVEELDFDHGELQDKQLLMLAELPKLETISLIQCEKISIDGIAAFIGRSSSIKNIILIPYDSEEFFDDGVEDVPRLTLEEIMGLQAKFPHINFHNELGVSYRPHDPNRVKE